MRDIFKQGGWLMLAQALGRLVGFFYTLFIAQRLGVDNFGLYSVGLAYFSLLSTISEFGFNRYLVRELAITTEPPAKILFNISVLRFSITTLIFVIFAIIIGLTDPDKTRTFLVLLSAVAVLPVTVAQTLDAFFIAKRKLQYSALAISLTSLFTTLLGVIFVSNGVGVTGTILALIFGQVFYLGILFFNISRQKISLSSKINKGMYKDVLRGSLPYGILGVLGFLYFRIDTILLSYLRGNYDTGIYGAAYKFLEAAIFIPSSLSIALFPVMAKLQDDKLKLKKIFYKSTGSVLGIGLIGFLGFYFILPILINNFLPSYIPAISAIKVLSFALPFIFLHVVASQIVLSSSKFLKQLIALSIFPLILNIVLNLIYIPKFGYMAASWVTVASDVFSFLILFIFLHLYYFKND